MRLIELVTIMKDAAMRQPAVRTVIDNDVLRINALPAVRYGVFAWQQGEHRRSAGGDFVRYAFTVFYIDRLTENRSNEVEVQSTGIEVLENIIRTVEDAVAGGARQTVSFVTFNQRFEDECAGAYARIDFTVKADGTCEQPYE